MLISLCGYATVGKDAIIEALGFSRCAYADELKSDLEPLISKLFPYKIRPWVLTKQEKAFVRPLYVEYGRTARRVDPDHWVKRLVIPSSGNVGIADCRYANEAVYAMKLGGTVIRVHRPGVDAANEEEERTIAEIDRLWPNLPRLVNDSTLEDAARRVMEIIGGKKN